MLVDAGQRPRRGRRRSGGRVACLCLIIYLIIQTSRRDPSGPDATDGYQHEQARSVWNRPDRRRAPGYGSSGQTGCWPVPHSAVPVPVGHGCGGGRFCCRLSSRPLPQCPQAHAAVAGVPVPAACGLRVSVRGPRLLSTPPDRRCLSAAPTWPEPRGVHGTGHRGSVRWTSGMRPGAGRPLAAADTATGPLSRAGTRRYAGGRPFMPTLPASAREANRRSRCPRWQHNLDAGGCPDQGVRRTAGCRRPVDTAAVSAVRPARRRLAMRPDGWCPPRTPSPPAGVRCYRNRSPARRPLVGCRHRRYARASWRPSRSPSWPRT
jgi:hypothetical protein